MADSDTLMAYLVPRLTAQVENAATEAQGYILNRSPRSMQALNALLREGGFDVEPITRVETQVTYEDGSRPDMAGYDKNNVKRLLVEAKFHAALLKGQASAYAQQFDKPGPAVLLFICPEVRIPTLWASIGQQIGKQWEWKPIDSPSGGRRARLVGRELQLVLVSWGQLLKSMASSAGDPDVEADIRQLQGLAERQDAEAFLPMHSEELNPDFARRVVGFNRLADDVVNSRGVPEKWMTTHGLQATSRRYGYGRYFHFIGVEWDFWFGVNHELWARNADTPLWLAMYDNNQMSRDEIGSALNVEAHDNWIPIHPKLGVEYDQVVDDIVSQLKVVAKIAGADLPAS